MTVPNAVWQLYRTNDLGEWVLVASFDSLAATVRCIIEIETIPVRGIFLQMHVGADDPSDSDAMSHFEYLGKHGAYVIKRQMH